MTAVTQVTDALKATEALKALFECPLSIDTLKDPVIDPCGHTFEREDIVRWLAVNNNCPLSRTPFAVNDLVPNRIMRQAMEILARRERPLNGQIEEQGANENERLILKRAMEELHPKTFARQAGDVVESYYNQLKC